jgi:ABC-type uncharacterized transport system substrate-binding protein
MKLLKILTLSFCFLISLSISSCNSANTGKNKIEKTSIKGKEYTSKYICPMYCKDSGSTEMGTCPACKMDYELNEEYSEIENN